MKDFLLDIFFPDGVECVLCNRLIDQPHDFLCSSCLEKLDVIIGKSCDGCGKSLPLSFDGSYCAECMGRDLLHAHGLSCVTYNEFSAEVIWKFKYHNCRYIGRMMGAALSELLQATYIDDIDLVVPVPIYKKKEALKGYNHSAIIAEEVARRCNKKVYTDLLVRRKATRPLKDLSKEERIRELEGVFEVKDLYQVLGPTGKRVLLVDDIFTTGTTIRECCSALQNSGFTDVIAMTYATGLL